VLARLGKVKGVEQCLVNRSGTLIRVTVERTADRDKVADEVLKVLAGDNREPSRLTGDELRRALAAEQWRPPDELSAIEFRTLAVRRVRGFARAEKLDRGVTEKLVRITEEQWDRLAGKAKPRGAKSDWSARCMEAAAAVADQAKELLTAEQTDRLRRHLTDPTRP
jgi:hypothetical protein